MTDISAQKEILFEIDQTAQQFALLLSSLTDEQLNLAPYEGSWTPAQVARHLIRSARAIATGMSADVPPAQRDPGAQVEMLRTTFLNFDTKMKSPEFILPEERHYDKPALLEEFAGAYGNLETAASTAQMDGLVEDVPFGPTTKWELLNFVHFHTQRHLHQLKKMVEREETRRNG